MEGPGVAWPGQGAGSARSSRRRDRPAQGTPVSPMPRRDVTLPTETIGGGRPAALGAARCPAEPVPREKPRAGDGGRAARAVPGAGVGGSSRGCSWEPCRVGAGLGGRGHRSHWELGVAWSPGLNSFRLCQTSTSWTKGPLANPALGGSSPSGCSGVGWSCSPALAHQGVDNNFVGSSRSSANRVEPCPAPRGG